MLAGPLLSVVAGLLLGMFQLAHRRAHEELHDRQIRLSILLVVAVAVVIVVIMSSDARAQLTSIPGTSIVYFALGGLIHFFLGFILMSNSQARVGAGRTGVLIGTTPVFSAIVGYAVFGEQLAPLVLAGIATVIAGVMVVSRSRISGTVHPPWKDFLFGLGTALCYSTSPIFVRFGVRSYDYPTVAVGIGMLVAAVASVVTVVARRNRPDAQTAGRARAEVTRRGVLTAGAAGVIIGIATWVRYVALGLSPLAVVTTMSRVSVPLVLLLSPVILKSKSEKASVGTWVGAGLIIAGSAVIGFSG